MEFSSAERYTVSTSTDADILSADVSTLTVLYGNMLNGFDGWDSAERWYMDAHRLCRWLARRYNAPIETVAGVLAVYSMRTSWRDNKRRTVRYFATGEHTGTMLQYDKVFGIERANGCIRSIMEILRGDKIRRFFHNILFPTTSPFATVDSWIVQPLAIAYSQLRGKYGTGETLYRRVERAIRTVARTLNRPVATVQAAIWFVLRGRWD